MSKAQQLEAGLNEEISRRESALWDRIKALPMTEFIDAMLCDPAPTHWMPIPPGPKAPESPIANQKSKIENSAT